MLHLLGRLFGNRDDDDAKASSASHHVSTLGSGATFHAYQDTDLYYFNPDSPAEDALLGLLVPGNGVALGLQFTCQLPCSVYCSPLAS